MFLAFIAIGLVFASPATAGDDALRDKVRELEARIDALSGQQSTQLEQSIESYLDESSAWKAADADGGMGNITITAAFTANIQGTVDQDPANRSIVSGDVDLGFHFQVTDNLDLHITATAAAGGSSSSTVNLSPTLSGRSDGIGTNGNVSTTGVGRAVNVYEAYIVHGLKMGQRTLYWEIGAMDPRVRFLQNEFADDENTQFINNLFDDVVSVLWQTGSSGTGVLGIHMWVSFGDNDAFTISWGFFNSGGQFFDNGSVFFQFSWKGKVGGREMNVHVMGNADDVNKDAAGDFTLAWGVSWDWWVHDKIGLFVRVATNDDDATRNNGAELDGQVGAVFNVIQGRPNDRIGFAVGLIAANDNVVTPPNEDEIVVELYYLYSTENGKLQITPYVMFVMDPGGIVSSTSDDLFILGLRIHVPF